VILEDSSGAALATNALQVPDPSLFGTAIWQLFAFQSPGEEPHAIRITGSIDSVTDITPVPEPATLSLLSVGGAILLRRRGSLRRSAVWGA
jgi:PEP-CTERM motif